MIRKTETLSLTPETIESILKDVKASRCFGRSERQMRLFTYLLKYETLEKSSPITQYAIALDVLGRPESFDPTTDSIVRVEMHRLRSSLENYNNSGSAYNLSIPTASYEVVASSRVQGMTRIWKHKRFVFAAAAAALFIGLSFGTNFTQTQQNASAASCSVHEPNVNIIHSGRSTQIHDYVENVLRSAMSQQSAFHLLQPEATCGSDAAPNFDIQITIMEQGAQFDLALSVLSQTNRSIVNSYNLTSETAAMGAQTPFYYKLMEVANTITLPSGNLARRAYSEDWGSDQHKQNYGCIIAMYDSYAGEIDSEFENIHQCLEDSVKSGDASLDSYGALASSYLDKARNNRPSTAADPMAAAKDILDQHGDQWPESREIAIAMIYHEAERSDFNAERMGRILSSMESEYDANAIVLFNIVMFKGFTLGQWDEAKSLSDYAKQIYSVREQSIFGVDAGYAFMRGDESISFEDCYKHYAETSVYANLIVNGCARLDGNELWQDLTERNLSLKGMDTAAARMDFLNTRVRDPEYLAKYEALFSN